MSNFDASLIDLVRAHPLLYERELRNSPYDSMKRKNELWHSIATSLKVDAKTCIMRWKTLREKLRHELAKEISSGGSSGSDWKLLEKMRFVEGHIKYHNERQLRVQERNAHAQLDELNASYLIEEVNDDEDDPLQEAMDEQSIERQDKEVILREIVAAQSFVQQEPMNISNAAANVANVTVTSTTAPRTTHQNVSSICVDAAREEHMKRIETLLGGLGEVNRTIAEKRILAYLCKCNLRAINNEEIIDVAI